MTGANPGKRNRRSTAANSLLAPPGWRSGCWGSDVRCRSCVASRCPGTPGCHWACVGGWTRVELAGAVGEPVYRDASGPENEAPQRSVAPEANLQAFVITLRPGKRVSAAQHAKNWHNSDSAGIGEKVVTGRRSAGEAEVGDSQAQTVVAAVAAALFDRDRASQALGMRLVEVSRGCARVSMTVRPDMLNGHDACHGGIIFSLADSAFAFACNSHNVATVAAAASIDFLYPAKEGDELIAEARELWRSKRNGLYEVDVSNQRGERIALFRGRSYSLGRQVLAEESVVERSGAGGARL